MVGWLLLPRFQRRVVALMPCSGSVRGLTFEGQIDLADEGKEALGSISVCGGGGDLGEPPVRLVPFFRLQPKMLSLLQSNCIGKAAGESPSYFSS